MAQKIFIIIAFALTALTSFSQNKNIKGTLRDSSTNEELIGAVIYVKGTKTAAYSQLDGTYKISIPDSLKDGTLVYKLISYKTIERKITESDFSSNPIILLKPDNTLQEVVVTDSKDKESEQSAINREKNADNVMSVMSAKTIQLSPDISVANNLQRMSGINVDRNSSGEGQYPIIRGMDKRYNYTMVNGIKIPSPDNKNRYVPMDIFPSELVDRIEVVKALTPNMEGDAIGGAMNIVMKDAPDRFILSANAAGGMSQMVADQGYYNYNRSAVSLTDPAQQHGNPLYAASPSDFNMNVFNYQKNNLPVNSLFGLTVGDRFFKKKKLGVIVSGTMQNLYKETTSTYFKPSAQPDGTQGTPTMNAPVFDDIQLRTYYTQMRRMGLNSKIDYKFNGRHKISLSGVVLSMLEQQNRSMIDSVLDIQRQGPGSGNVSIDSRSKMQQQNIYNATLIGEHNFFNDFKVIWTGAYSLAKSDVPDWSDFSTSHSVTGGVASSSTLVKSMTRYWVQNSDKDLTGKLDLSYKKNLLGINFELAIGGLYRHKVRSNYYNEYDLSPVNSGSQVFTTFQNAQLFFPTGTASGSANSNPNIYSSQEDIAAGYGQLKFRPIKKLQILGGVRLENTYQTYNTSMPESFVGQNGWRKYYDVLPSLHLKYELTSKQNLRASYYSSIARPGFFEVIPYQINGDYYNEAGNPYLKHTTANNYDLRYEWFPTANSQIMAGGFYKQIYNPIEWAFVRSAGKASAYYYEPGNYGNATNYGLELVAVKYYKSFGLSANYTYTHSSITRIKSVYYRDATGNLVTNANVPQTTPLQGQAAHIGNLSFLYKNQKLGINAQVALVYTGQRIVQLSQWYGLDYWQDPFYQLDISAEKKIGKHFTIYLKANNLTNTPYSVYIHQTNTFTSGRYVLPYQDNANKILVQRDYYKQTYLMGLRFKF